jgi:YgiT-type zinc finger domain-containing protein
MKTSRAAKLRAGQRRRLVPDKACPECGIPMRETEATLRFPVNGEEITVPGAPHLSCPKCREVVLRFDDARNLRQRALRIYRQ